MKIPVSNKLISLAKSLSKPLYIVGGYCRNYLLDEHISNDIDLSSPLKVEEILPCALSLGFTAIAEYKITKTLLLSDGENKYEFTTFRKDVYKRGHKPLYTEYTEDINEDATRRDFKCNAVYYDVKNQKIVDPLNGVADIKNKVLNTVVSPKVVFGVDGLRLMRLARFSAELGFTPTKEVILGALENADNIKDISSERIYTELKKILSADQKYPFSPKNAHYLGLKVLDETRVLDRIIPELTLGRNKKQNQNYHDYDVLEHSLLTAFYAKRENRMSALLHDVGKPYCMDTYGRYKLHDIEGEKIAVDILKRLKADKKQIKETAFMVKYHMAGVKKELEDCVMRKFLVENFSYAENFIDIMKADSMAGKKQAEVSNGAKRWQNVYKELLSDGTPLKVSHLKIKASDLKDLGVEEKDFSSILKELLFICVLSPQKNQKESLIEIVKKMQENNEKVTKNVKND